ncbi:hypothetical protein GCM10011504_20210 [Siccirubricoccus deserti]|uniref:Secreted protein n=1 Tax=Siccirubricoccus deserti TaxID=2013562 RepID=A0A9X0UCM5_9PROT|nr:hypothetical protein [Siccirubricoccus deserti]MBC4015444.1 hypothetical protein [Siccirubricoccus deserti]GGC41733.1 hypothetical protein GCM10011504_20210 [Siccirubricoccus deserti]
MSRRLVLPPMKPWCALALAATLAACAQPQQQAAAPATRIFATDLQGAAKSCTVPQQVSLSPDRPAEVSMTVGNDGGWCGISVAQSGPKPFDAGLVTARPANGRVLVRKVGDHTRVDYFPNPAFGGTDTFAVRLLPGGATMRVAVTVNYTPPPAPPAPPAPPPRTPARRR